MVCPNQSNLVPVAILALLLPAMLDVCPGYLDAVLQASLETPEGVGQHVERDRPESLSDLLFQFIDVCDWLRIDFCLDVAPQARIGKIIPAIMLCGYKLR